MNIRRRADNCIAQGSLTNSKRPTTFVDGVYPTHASHGRGAILFCDGSPYIDYYSGLGSNLYGYGNPHIREAVLSRLNGGSTLSLSSEIEVTVAENLKEVFIFTDLWKFGKNGSDVCNAALKIARTYTKRDLVLSDDYHGNGDDFISLAEPAIGVPKRDWMKSLSNNWDLIKDAAAVIIEPVVVDYSKERRAYLDKLRQECTKHGTVLIFDEIITGLRFKKNCVSHHFGIFPDIILLGKALGGGLPLSAMGGKKEIMNCGDYFYSGTFFGETCSLAACKEVLDMIRNPKLPYSIDDLWVHGQTFLNKFNALNKDIQIVGYPTRGTFIGDNMVKALFWQESARAGILYGPTWFFNYLLPEHTDLVIDISRDIFNRIKMGAVRLDGRAPQVPFAQKQRGI